MATTKHISVFDELKQNPKYTPERSVNWYRANIAKFGLRPGDKRLLKDQTHITQKIITGFLYMFAYEAITPNLPYFDMFPLTFVFNVDRTGFHGINFHYLPYKLRFVLYDKMAVNLSNSKFDETTRIRANWAMLSNFAKFPQVAPAVKRYLHTQRRSQILKVPIDDFKIALMLPVENFTGASKEKVWRDSMKTIRNI